MSLSLTAESGRSCLSLQGKWMDFSLLPSAKHNENPWALCIKEASWVNSEKWWGINRHFTEENIQVANRHLKWCFASSAIRKMQIERQEASRQDDQSKLNLKRERQPETECYFLKWSILDIYTLNVSNFFWGYKAESRSLEYRKEPNRPWTLVGMRMAQPLRKTVGQVLKNTTLEITMWPKATLSGIYPRKTKTYGHRKTYTQMLVADLFVIVQTWLWLRDPSPGEWLNEP